MVAEVPESGTGGGAVSNVFTTWLGSASSAALKPESMNSECV